jgi:hypothetical protein
MGVERAKGDRIRSWMLDANTHTSPQLEQKLRRLLCWLLVSRGPDMTSLLLLRMMYDVLCCVLHIFYVLILIIHQSSSMHATCNIHRYTVTRKLHTLIS